MSAGIARVGLFVDADDARIEAVLARAPSRYPAVSRQRDAAAGRRGKAGFGLPIIKAVAIAGPQDVLAAKQHQVWRICSCSMPSPRGVRLHCRAATASPSTGS